MTLPPPTAVGPEFLVTPHPSDVRIGELSRGIHPTVLSTGGLGPALRGLARRAPVPVTVNVGLSKRPPERIEVAVYFIVAEALTNVAKHAHASNVLVDVQAIDGGVRVSVSMTGSAEPTRRAGQGFSACETASTRSAGRYRWPAPPRGPPSSLSFR